jgi:lysine decarboxylase
VGDPDRSELPSTAPAPSTGAVDASGHESSAPLHAAWVAARQASRTPFTIPGHKGRTDLVGEVVAHDLPLHGGLDTVALDHGLLRKAERLAADLWGADWCRFSVGGSTHGNQALALAVGAPGDEVIVSRTLHRSMLLGLVLAGLVPRWVRPVVDPGTGLPGGVPATAVTEALGRHPEARAVLVGEPSYAGGLGDLAALARVAHGHPTPHAAAVAAGPGDAAAVHRGLGIPLVVDAAWAPHFGFHPSLPDHALALGADALVTSAHKTLPAWSQAAIVLARTERLDPARLDRCIDATHTTSPAGTILASTDAARALLADRGRALLGETIELVARARTELERVTGVRCPAGPSLDPTKLVVLLHGTAAHGVRVGQRLHRRGLPLEMADRDVLIPIVTMADRAEHVDALLLALREEIEASARDGEAAPRPVTVGAAWGIEPEQVLDPRTAFFAAHRTVELDRAIGEVSAELVAPYPPGVPVLAPGERITADTVAALRRAAADGARLAYAADPSLATVQIVAPGTLGR